MSSLCLYFFILTNLFLKVAQDAETVLAIMRDVINRIKSERPEVRNVYMRSDNAGKTYTVVLNSIT